MGSLGNEKDKKKMEVTQISLGGFRKDAEVSAKELADFLEDKAGAVLRCRLKKSWTPPESYPDYSISDFRNQKCKFDDYDKVLPHAFVHFLRTEGAEKAINVAERGELIYDGRPLIIYSGYDSSFRVQRRKKVDTFKFQDVNVEIGTLVSQDEFWVGWKGPESGVNFLIDPFQDCCQILLTKEVAFSFKGSNQKAYLKCDFKTEFLVREIEEIRIFKEQASFSVILHLRSSPSVYYRTADDDIYISCHWNLLDDDDPWIRTTDFTSSAAIGRCSSYRISVSPRFGYKLEKAMDYLKQRRISLYSPKYELQVKDEPLGGLSLADSFFCMQHIEGISFQTMFMVNALLHKGIMNQHQMSDEFFGLLKGQSDLVNDAALRHIYTYRRSLFDASKRLKTVQMWLLKNPKLVKSTKVPIDNVEVRRLVVTPTKAYCLPPEVELSNRVLRMFKDVSDRFLRVTFMDEGMQQLNSNVLTYYVTPIVQRVRTFQHCSEGEDLTSNSFPQKTTIFRRVRTFLTNGFDLCGRRYSFLAFSSNQLRDRSAWFFAENGKYTVKYISNWMGKFSNKNVAKFSARMGQCFSSTYATVTVPPEKVNRGLEDIERNGYNFSDGIGKIDPELASGVAQKLQLSDNPPSAYQIRFAGCKGVVAVWPGNGDDFQIHLRPSMNKFESNHTVLEVISWTRFQPGFLNRQIVTLLSALGVPDTVFASMQDSMVFKLNQMLVDAEVAYEVLTSSCSEQGNTAAMMLSAGFKPQTEPHLRGMLSCLRSSQLGDLLSRARIFVPSGRWLMGCLDELGVLENGQCFIQASSPSLEKCFSKHGSRFSDIKNIRQVIKGKVAIAKNPCLHPGDVRILEAVDMPDLHHLVDCLVFPQNGDRPHTNEASGSDLDGDLYFVTWDENLMPPSKKSWVPMDYTPAEANNLPRPVERRDIIDFFVKNMVNENLGVICNAHVVHADLSDSGALDEKCLHLAELAAQAVDFPKTGKLVKMPPALKPKIYPDFMDKLEFQSYRSEKILGKLYRKIKEVHDEDVPTEMCCVREDIPYDLDLEIPGASDFISDAWQKKCSYDGQLNALLGQYKVQFEGEVVTGHFWSLPKYNSRKQGDLKERLKNSYSALHKEFRLHFESTGVDFSQLTDDERSAVYEQKASAWYQVTYHPRWLNRSRQLTEPDGEEVPARLSFAWIAADYLVRIKVRCQERKKNLNSTKPIDSLATYLLDKM